MPWFLAKEASKVHLISVLLTLYLGKIAKKEKEMQTETKKLIYYNYSQYNLGRDHLDLILAQDADRKTPPVAYPGNSGSRWHSIYLLFSLPVSHCLVIPIFFIQNTFFGPTKFYYFSLALPLILYTLLPSKYYISYSRASSDFNSTQT